MVKTLLGTCNLNDLTRMVGPLIVALISLGQVTLAQAEDSGVLLLEEFRGTAADLYDPTTGKALLVPGAPLDPPPPMLDSLRVGIIDSGILPDHPQLRNLVVAMRDFTGEDDPLDRIGHGTAVALRYMAAEFENFSEYKALAERAGKTVSSPAFIIAKVTDAQGRIDQKHVIEAIHWLTAQGARLINISLGFLGAKEEYIALCNAIAQSDALFTAAAGNFGPDVPVYPAACDLPNLMSVAAAVEGRPWPKSGRGTHAAESELRLMTPAMYYYEMAQTAARAGDFDRARQNYLSSIQTEENALALFGLAVLDSHGKNFDAAYARLARAAQLAPDNAQIEAELGAVLLMQQRLANAKTHLDRAIELDPENVAARTNRAIALVRLGKPELALEDLNVARQMSEDTSRIDALILELLELPQSPPMRLPDSGEAE